MSKKTDEGGNESWDCVSSIYDQISYLTIFRHSFVDEYESECSEGNFECPHMEEYFNHVDIPHEERLRHSKVIPVLGSDMHCIQEKVLDKIYNACGEIMPCGTGVATAVYEPNVPVNVDAEKGKEDIHK